MTLRDDQEEHLELIQDCENRESRMSDWERSFIDSIKSQIQKGNSLTEKQEATLDTIWTKVTSRG